MKHIKNIHKDVKWFTSYMDKSENQGKALILCQYKKIKQLIDILETIKCEIELAEDPKDYPPEVILESIKYIINNIPEIEHTEDEFKWVG